MINITFHLLIFELEVSALSHKSESLPKQQQIAQVLCLGCSPLSTSTENDKYKIHHGLDCCEKYGSVWLSKTIVTHLDRSL